MIMKGGEGERCRACHDTQAICFHCAYTGGLGWIAEYTIAVCWRILIYETAPMAQERSVGMDDGGDLRRDLTRRPSIALNLYAYRLVCLFPETLKPILDFRIYMCHAYLERNVDDCDRSYQNNDTFFISSVNPQSTAEMVKGALSFSREPKPGTNPVFWIARWSSVVLSAAPGHKLARSSFKLNKGRIHKRSRAIYQLQEI